MEILVRGTFSKDVYDEIAPLSHEFSQMIEALNLENVKSSIECLIYFPVLTSDKFDLPTKSGRRYSRKDNTEFVSVEIAFDRWKRSDNIARFIMIEEGLKKAINNTKESRIKEESKNFIIEEIEEATKNYIKNKELR